MSGDEQPVSHATSLQRFRRKKTLGGASLAAHGEPYQWALGGALATGILLVIGFLSLILYNGLITFWPKPVVKLELVDGRVIAGEPTKSELYRPRADQIDSLPEVAKRELDERGGYLFRTMYRVGNYDLYNEDFRWVADYEVSKRTTPEDLFYIERKEWGPFVGRIDTLSLDGAVVRPEGVGDEVVSNAVDDALDRRGVMDDLRKVKIAGINHEMEAARLALRGVLLSAGEGSAEYQQAAAASEAESAALQERYEEYSIELNRLEEVDAKFTVTLVEVEGRSKTLPLSELVRLYPANKLSWFSKLGVYFSRWGEFLTAEPREANTEGGVMPAIFGTVIMTLMMALAVAPFGIMAALYLREYATQGRLVSLVRVCVNNLAGVPSIVYGVFGLGFFAYLVGARIDELFFIERLPSPTFGTGGILWASLTLALLTVPVVIVSTEEALAAVPRSLREGSMGCGASKWQTIRYIVLPRALPGIMTGLILAMARGAGEVAPLMLVGVVKLAPELPIDSMFPYVHLERSFMHLGFHIYDVGFQSRNSEAGKPMVFVTTMLLITIVFSMNAAAIMIRNRLKKRFSVGHF